MDLTKKLLAKRIGFIGFGLENQALLAWFKKNKITADYTICDSRTDLKKNIPGISWRLGKDYLNNLSDFEIVFRSPGCPLFLPEIKAAQKRGTEITSAMNLFMLLCPTKNIIGVTGSKGKGTTSSLIYTILKQAGQAVYLGGNIGVAPFSFINRLKADSYVVLELSSFQLEDLKISPRYSILTNLFQEHLEPADPNNPNYHKNFEDYKKAKLNIAKYPENKYFLVPERLSADIKGPKVKYFETCDYPSRLAGEFNKENIAAAADLAKILKIDEITVKQAIASFKGLPHRLERVAKKNGVTYYDNSFSTTPESTIADLKSFPEAIIMLGGADKGASFKELAKEVVRSAKLVILFKGEASPRLKRELLAAGFKANKLTHAGSMLEAVRKANERSQPGDVVLLSTACASFGIFKNYKERGDLFKKYVKNL